MVTEITLCGRAILLANFQCRGVLLIWTVVGQGPTVFAGGKGRKDCLDIFLSPIISLFFSTSLCETALSHGRNTRYRRDGIS